MGSCDEICIINPLEECVKFETILAFYKQYACLTFEEN